MKVHVFQESQLWNTVEAWWQLPQHILNALHITTYQLPENERGEVIDASGNEVNPDLYIRHIAGRHHGCVLVY